MYRNTYVEVNLDNLKSNIKNIINQFNGYDYYFGVVKGNAYGHGAYAIKTMIDSGINYLAVSSLEEALDIRKWNKDIPILCLQPIDVKYYEVCIKNNVTMTIHDYQYFENLTTLDLKEPLKCHLKIDTGMNRLGINNHKEVKKVYDYCMSHNTILLEGIFTHMATSGINDKNWDNQLETFKKLTKKLDFKKIPIIHIDRSITMMAHQKLSFCNGVRLGIAMYGYNQMPSKGKGIKAKLRQLRNDLKRKFLSISSINNTVPIELKPVLSLYSDVIQIKNVKKKQYVGYGMTYRAKKDIVAATIPIGYADGFDLRNSGRNVVINNKRYPIIGSVNMGMISVKVDNSVKVGDKVTLIGQGISAREVSHYLNTTIYEIITTIASSVPRVYTEKQKVIHTEESKW